MKKIFLFFSMLLAMGLSSACSSNGEKPNDVLLQPGDNVTLYGDGIYEIKAVYSPISYQDAPQWIREIIDNKEKHLDIYLSQGERNGETIYYSQSVYNSSIGNFLNKDGEYIMIKDMSYIEFFSETSNWKLIFYHKHF
jgi:hypothetical protein